MYSFTNGHKYVGEYKDGKRNGQGTFTFANGEKYLGKFKNGKYNGQGIFTFADGHVQEGIWADDKFIRAEKINLSPEKQQTDLPFNEERRKLDADRQSLEFERQRLTEERNLREQAKQSFKLSLQTTTINPDANGVVIISVRTNADTSSLKVNGEEQGGRPDGNYVIKKVARVGQDTNYVITAVDSNGNTESTTITVSRQAVSKSSNQTVSLKPENIKRAPTRDAVAIIIGIQNYKRVPKADFANNDAKEFYEYAIRGLGIKPENIKLLIDEEADELEIVKAFENWLPLQVNKNKTDVYVFYSGHGLPSPDGQSLYFLPYGVDKQYLSRTAVGQKEVVALLTASKPKSVTMFIDACYSGQTRGGETLLASAKPISLKTDTNAFPSNFTVITASANDQISSSSPELKHGIFSFYLMKGMEGDADGNKDGKITVGEMQEYLSDKVLRQAMSMSRKQDTQLVGDTNKVLISNR
jgi:prepilin-type processing-associated H-X9-DG protein